MIIAVVVVVVVVVAGRLAVLGLFVLSNAKLL